MGKQASFVTGAVLAVLAATASSVRADPVVVELFTSQGCSSCPPANANLAAIAGRPDVLALSFGVTYWDQLGWKDTFAQDKFTARQYAYARSLGHDGPFTPQVVVDGIKDGTGITRAEFDRLLTQAAPLAGPSLSLRPGNIQIGAAAAFRGEADVWLVRYDPRTISVPITAGENGGVTLPHRNVVKALTHLGLWRGDALQLVLPPTPQGLLTAILIQRTNGGPILAATKG
ncbi:MAG TPA: DUF1223 domain-containing protein [Rhizomicrobium sp.]|nr:DUF1223 domain-containing protein [Rhizomicrobium sp.]